MRQRVRGSYDVSTARARARAALCVCTCVKVPTQQAVSGRARARARARSVDVDVDVDVAKTLQLLQMCFHQHDATRPSRWIYRSRKSLSLSLALYVIVDLSGGPHLLVTRSAAPPLVDAVERDDRRDRRLQDSSLR